MRRVTLSSQSGADDSAKTAEQRARIARLHAQARDLRARLARVKAEHAAGRLSRDEYVAQSRAIAREMAALGTEIHDISAEPPEGKVAPSFHGARANNLQPEDGFRRATEPARGAKTS